MLSDEVIDKVVERLAVRMEQANEYVLQEIGKSIKKIGTLSPSKAQELAQMMKYGGDYDKIVKKLVEITKLNKKDIYKIFQEVAKKEYEFAEQFYKYRNKKYIKWDENTALQNQVNAIAKITADDYVNMSRTFAFATRNAKGKLVYTDISKKYQQVLDEAVLNTGQGKESFDSAMQRTLKQLAESGIRTVDYASGKSRRVDSAVRMNLKEGLRTLHNEMQEQFGKEFDADGVEISVHANPAPDHALAQGRQFEHSPKKIKKKQKTEWQKLQENGHAVDYKGLEVDLHRELKDGTVTKDFRPISKLNCHHYTFAIVLGVSEPEYSDEQLKKIMDDNEKGFEFDGKHYTNYEGTQLQRKIETEIRKQKDQQILARASGDMDLVRESQEKIGALTKKYNELSKVSGLRTKIERMRVPGYNKIKVPEVNEMPRYEIKTKEDLLNKWDDKFKNDNIVVRRILNADPKLIDTQITQVDKLLNKYDFVKKSINESSEYNGLKIQVGTPETMGNNYAGFIDNRFIEFNEKYFLNEKELPGRVKETIERGWWQKVYAKNYAIYPVTHEYGHLLEFKMIEKMKKGVYGHLYPEEYINGDLKIFEQISKEVPDLEKYISNYGKSIKKFEWFAETFTQMELGEETPLTKALKKYIEDFMEGNYEDFR